MCSFFRLTLLLFSDVFQQFFVWSHSLSSLYPTNPFYNYIDNHASYSSGWGVYFVQVKQNAANFQRTQYICFLPILCGKFGVLARLLSAPSWNLSLIWPIHIEQPGSSSLHLLTPTHSLMSLSRLLNLFAHLRSLVWGGLLPTNELNPYSLFYPSRSLLEADL